MKPEAGWKALGEILGREELRVIRGAGRRVLLEEWQEICARERALDDRLYLGIIGGTGVGKSTLINAIAGAPISRASDRRPTSDRVVVYRHRDTPLSSELPAADLAQPEAVHGEAALERTLVLDFPDFDSVAMDHAAILGRFLPRLDVLLVVVDDEKYADQRLYDLLRALPQARGNLHFVLNKLDRLAERYPGRWGQVAEEILEDLRAKLILHGGLEAERSRLKAISARAALERRLDGGRDGAPPSSSTPSASTVGEFQQVMDLLEGYRAEKRRLAAKAANLEAQKRALAARTRAAGLDPAAGARSAAARAEMSRRAAELEAVRGAIPRSAVGPRERQALLSEAWEGAGAAEASSPGGRRRPPPRAEELAAAARAHFRPHLETLKAAEKDLASRVAAVAGESPPAAPAADLFLEAARAFRRDLEARGARARRFRTLRIWALPVLVAALALWWALYPLVLQAVKEGVPSPAGFLRRLAEVLVAALNPWNVVFFLGLLAGAWALGRYLARRRVARAAGEALAAYEEGLRKALATLERERLARVAAPLEAWERERAQLEEALEGFRGQP